MSIFNFSRKPKDYLKELTQLVESENFLKSITDNIKEKNYSEYFKKKYDKKNVIEYKNLFDKILRKYTNQNILTKYLNAEKEKKNNQEHMNKFFVFSKYNFMNSLTETEKKNLNNFGIFSSTPITVKDTDIITSSDDTQTKTYDVFPIRGPKCIPPLNLKNKSSDHAYNINVSIRLLFKQYKESIRNPLYSKYEIIHMYHRYEDPVDYYYLSHNKNDKYNMMNYSMNEDTAFFNFYSDFEKYTDKVVNRVDQDDAKNIDNHYLNGIDIDNKYQKKYNVLVEQYQKEKVLLNNSLSDKILDEHITVFCSYLFPKNFQNYNDGDIIEVKDNLVTTLNIHESSDRHMIRKYLHRDDPNSENLKQIAIFLPKTSKIAPIIFDQIQSDDYYVTKNYNDFESGPIYNPEQKFKLGVLYIKNKIYDDENLEVVNDVRNIVLSDKGVLVKTDKSFLINFEKVNLTYFNDDDIEYNQETGKCRFEQTNKETRKDEQEDMNIPVFIYFNDKNEAEKFLELYNPSHEILHEEVIKNNSPIKHYIVGETTKSRSKSRSRSSKLNGGKNKKNKSKKQKTKK